MIEPIHSKPVTGAPSTTPNVPELAHKMRQLLEHFSQSLQKLLADPTLAEKPHFQRELAHQVILPLNDVVQKSNLV